MSTFHYCDYSLLQLPSEVRQRLERRGVANLFCTLGFGESYCYPPGERVCFLENRAGEIVDQCVYRESPWMWFLRQIDVLGPIDPNGHLFRELRRRTRAHRINSHWISPQEFPRNGQAGRALVFRRTGEDLCIALPDSPSLYLQSLGSTTRKHLPYYLRRLRKEWGEAWSFEVCTGQEIHKAAFDQLLELQRLRAATKRQQTLWTEGLREHRWSLVKEKGMLCCLWYREKLVGGTLSFVYANEAYLIVIAHDPEFDRLNVGNLTLWFTIEHLIHCRHKVFHLMWGQSFYKKQFGGVLQPLFKMEFFASSWVAAAWRVAEALRILKAWDVFSRFGRRIALRMPRHVAKTTRIPSVSRQASHGGG